MTQPVDTALPGNYVQSAPASHWSAALRYYALAVLTLVAIVNYVDRQVLSILIEPIKADLGISDTQVGLLTGIAFAAFYVIAGFPLARMADAGVRRNLIAGCLAFWSLASIACGFAQNFIQLVLARIGVASGEAGSSPATQSLLADIFPLEQRGKAMGILMAGQSFGIAFGIFIGGWLSQMFGWRTVFLFVGAPGLLLALLILLTVREPLRGMSDKPSVSGPDQTETDRVPATSEILRFMWGQKSYLCILGGFALNGLTGQAVLVWFPVFMMRVHHMEPVKVGFLTGTLVAAGLVLGSLTSGFLADRLGATDRRWYLRSSAFGALMMAPLAVGFALSPSIAGIVVLFLVYKAVGGFVQPPAFAIVQSIAPPRMRGSATFAITVVQNLIGTALGPLIIGMMNDALSPSLGVEAIRYSLVAVSIFTALGGFSHALGNRWVRADIERAMALS